VTFTIMIDRDLCQVACKSSKQFGSLMLTPASTHSTQSTHNNTANQNWIRQTISNHLPRIVSIILTDTTYW